MATLLPPVPYWVFCIVEPVSTAAGFAVAILTPDEFVAQQLPDTPLTALAPSGRLMAWQTGNLFGIMAMMAIAVLWSTTEAAVVRRYLVALFLGDVGHLMAVWWIMGSYEFFGAHRWTGFTWGNVGFTIFLAVTRLATLAGVLGPIQARSSTKVKSG